MKAAVLVIVLFTSLAATQASGMIGGVQGMSVIDENSQEAARQAVRLLNSDNGLKATLGSNPSDLQLVTVKGKSEGVRTQVVAGVNYFMTLAVKDGSGSTYDIDVVLWARPWLAAQNSPEAFQLTRPDWDKLKSSASPTASANHAKPIREASRSSVRRHAQGRPGTRALTARLRKDDTLVAVRRVRHARHTTRNARVSSNHRTSNLIHLLPD
ncbi:hypothetical protein QJQ45_012633 [Haematococcus lacustris]|nr:hypothetical protein QJQ45_012633 [Haematococcus lacustris]